MKNYCLSDLIEIEALQNMADSLYQSTGMPLGIIDAIDNSVLVTVEEIIGMSPFDFMSSDEAERTIPMFSETQANHERIAGLENTLIAKDGSEKNFETNGTPLFDEKGNFLGYMGTCRDITERKHSEKALQESEQRFRVMADGTPVMIWAHDAKGNIEYINTAFSRFFGVNLEQIHGQNRQPLIHEDNREKYVDDFMQALKGQKTFHAAAWVKNTKGEWRWIESYGSPRFSADGKFCGMVGSSPDITERKQAEENLKMLNKELEQKVAERTRVAKDRAKKLQKLVGELTFVEQKERLQLMGGSLQIESSPGNGAALSLIVPLETKEETKDGVIRKIRAEIKKTKTDEDKIRILVVDDHTVARQGLSTLLGLHSGIEMVGEAGDGQEAIEKARQLHPDVILMDINMPKMDGIQATRIIRSELPSVRIVGLSMHDKQDQADQMLQAGASAYCTKDGSTDEILSAIRRSD